MKYRMAAVVVAGSASLAALESSSPSTAARGSDHGYITWLIGPAVGWEKAPFVATVELISSGHPVATERVATGAQFHFTEPAGTYTVKVVGHKRCSTTMTFVARKVRVAHVSCSPYKGGGPTPG